MSETPADDLQSHPQRTESVGRERSDVSMFATMTQEEARAYFENAMAIGDPGLDVALEHIVSGLNMEPIEILLTDIIPLKAQRALLPHTWAVASNLLSMYAGTDTFVKLFERTGFVSDFDGVTRPDEPIDVYRGVTGRQSYLGRGMSWTLDLDKARWFAHRHDHLTHPMHDGKHVIEPTVWRSVAPPAAVLALFYEQNELEVVVNPRRLRQVRLLECSEPELSEEAIAEDWEMRANLDRVLRGLA